MTVPHKTNHYTPWVNKDPQDEVDHLFGCQTMFYSSHPCVCHLIRAGYSMDDVRLAQLAMVWIEQELKFSVSDVLLAKLEAMDVEIPKRLLVKKEMPE